MPLFPLGGTAALVPPYLAWPDGYALKERGSENNHATQKSIILIYSMDIIYLFISFWFIYKALLTIIRSKK